MIRTFTARPLERMGREPVCSHTMGLPGPALNPKNHQIVARKPGEFLGAFFRSEGQRKLARFPAPACASSEAPDHGFCDSGMDGEHPGPVAETDEEGGPSNGLAER